MRILVVAAAALAACSSDAGSAPSAPDLAARSCTVPSDCDPVLGCPDSTGCNWCGCYLGSFACGQVACLRDGGPVVAPSCQSDGDCAAGSHCVYEPGCAHTSGRCIFDGVCDGMLGGSADSFCDCNGHTVAMQLFCGVRQPYQHVGACG